MIVFLKKDSSDETCGLNVLLINITLETYFQKEYILVKGTITLSHHGVVLPPKIESMS